MKLALRLTHQEIVDILTQHLRDKVGSLEVGDVKLLVSSKENYRGRGVFEKAEVIVLNQEAIDQGTPGVSRIKEPSSDDKPELRVEAEANG